MTTKITDTGELIITPDTELEAFALQMCRNLFQDGRNCSMTIDNAVGNQKRLVIKELYQNDKIIQEAEPVLIKSEIKPDKKLQKSKNASRSKASAEDYIIELLKDNISGLNASEITEGSNFAEVTIFNALNRLYKSGELDKDKTGSKIIWRIGSGKFIKNDSKNNFADNHKPYADYRQ